MLKRLFVFLKVMLLFPMLICAQQNNGLRHEVSVLSVENGLPSRNIVSATQDHKGMIWLATDRGLCVYNGLGVQVYDQSSSSSLTLPSSIISDLAEDDLGRLWVCTAQGLCVISADRSYFWSRQSLGIPDSIFTKRNSFIESHPEGGFWFLAGKSLFRIRLNQMGMRLQKLGESPFSVYAPKKMIASKKGELWIIAGNQVAIWANNDFDCIHYPIQRAGKQQSVYLNDVFTTAINNLGDSITLLTNFVTPELFSLSINHQQRIWKPQAISETLEKNIPAFKILQTAFKNQADCQEQPYLKEIIQDQQHNDWFITNLGVYGVANTSGQLFHQIDALANQSCRKIFQDSLGNIWFNTYAGLSLLDAEHNKITFFSNPIAAWEVIELGLGEYLICHEAATGLERYRLQNGKIKRLKSYPFRYVLGMVKMGDTLWMVNNQAELLGFDLKKERLIQKIPFYNTSSQVLAGILKTMVVDKKKNLWVGGAGGLYFLQRQSNGLYRRKNHYPLYKLNSTPINTLYLDRHQKLWIGTQTEGLISYDLSTQKITSYQHHIGLAHNNVFSIQGSNEDQLIWAGTLNGLSCLNVDRQQFFNFYVDSGLPSNEFNTSATLLDNKGILYIGGVNGVASIDPGSLNLASSQLIQPYLELSISNLNRHQSKVFFPEHKSVVHLSPALNYTALRFFNSNPYSISASSYYRYKIKGLFDEWRFAKASERILLGNLKAGTYSFVLSVQLQGNWSEPYRLTLQVSAHWYQSWWFYSLCGLVLLGVLYVLYRLRVAQLKAQYKLRKQISDDLHDDLGTRIYALKSLAYQITQAEAKQYKLSELLTHFETLSQETLLTIRNFIWAFDPKNDQLQDLIERMEKFASTAIKPVVPNTLFVTFSGLSSHKMLPGTKYHGLRLFQELLTNMVKHTFSQRINIDFQKDERFLQITVQNFYSSLRETESQPEHYGQETMAHRILEVGGQLSWQDEDHCQIAIIRLPFA